MEVLHIRGGARGLREAQNVCERQHHAVMAEAQAKTAAAGFYHGVGLVQEILKERKYAQPALLGAGHKTLPEAPAGVVCAETDNWPYYSWEAFKEKFAE